MNNTLETKKFINTFLFADLLALEELINKMNHEGYRFKSIGSFVVFERSYADEKTIANTVYSVSIHKKGFTTANGDTPDVKDYRKMCADIGWELVGSHLSWQVFSSTKENAEKNPLIRDEWTEYRRMRKSLIKMMLVFCAVFMPFLISIIIDIFDSGYSQFLRNKDIIYTASAFIIGILLVFNLLKELYWIIRELIKTKTKQPLIKRSVRYTKINQIFVFTALAVIAASFPVGALADSLSDVPSAQEAKYITLADMGYQDDSTEVIPYEASSSLFVPLSYSYMELAMSFEADAPQPYDAFIFTNVYQAKTDEIADNIANIELKDSDAKISIDNLDQLWDNSFSSGYYLNDSLTSVLLMDGKNVLIIRSSYDLSDADNISKCKNALGI